jgi:hypothetical protein
MVTITPVLAQAVPLLLGFGMLELILLTLITGMSAFVTANIKSEMGASKALGTGAVIWGVSIGMAILIL